MKFDPAEFEFAVPPSLRAALEMLSQSHAGWLPIAGGTDVMVQFAAGTLGSRKLLSIWNLPELRRIDLLPGEVQIGAGSTYTDLREHETVSREFPLLVRAASWTGGIANQNRGTIGGNIVNASPAADSLPALLVYDAELVLVSVRGERRVAYHGFHTGYKQMDLGPDELVRAICLPRRFSTYFSYARKVGTRNAQAISKVGIAALARIEKAPEDAAEPIVEDVRIALASVAPAPIRLTMTEQTLNGRHLDPARLALARQKAMAEIQPISDIRSTADYRAAVVGNLVTEFLVKLREANTPQSPVLARWNALGVADAESEMLACCGSRNWARRMANRRPIFNQAELFPAADEIWRNLLESDWDEAFRSHPRIGESHPKALSGRSAKWSAGEQSSAASADDALRLALADGNREYAKRFGRTFIVCAAGKSAAEILEILQRRLRSDEATELREAAEQQRQITRIRLRKWLTE